MEYNKCHIRGLCHRCENRANFLETGHAPRYECGSDIIIASCYCYKPTKPVILKRNEGDKRPQFGPWMISARSHRVGLADFKLALLKTKKGNIIYCVPEKD